MRNRGRFGVDNTAVQVAIAVFTALALIATAVYWLWMLVSWLFGL
jgi:hypothetical protein